jgi:hypothetical protein
LFFRQISAKSGNVGLTEDENEKGTIWTITAYDANDYPTYNSYSSWQKEGKVYFLNNQDFNYGLRNLFIRSNVVNALSLHPIFIHKQTLLMAIRATNVDSNQSNYSNWYGLENNELSAKLSDPSCCWKLLPAPANDIKSTTKPTNIVKTKYFSLDGIHSKNPTKKGIYIRQDQLSDGSIQQKKIAIQ